jgi:hypothetical protein
VMADETVDADDEYFFHSYATDRCEGKRIESLLSLLKAGPLLK